MMATNYRWHLSESLSVGRASAWLQRGRRDREPFGLAEVAR